MYSPPQKEQKETHTFIVNIHDIVKHRSKIKYPSTAERTHTYFIVNIHEIVKHRINQILLSSIREVTNMNTVGDIGDIVRGGQGQAQRPVGKDGKKANQGENFVPKYLWKGGC